MTSDLQNIEAEIERILDKHAEYYIKETAKFFVADGHSPALSRSNTGDLEARQALAQLCSSRELAGRLEQVKRIQRGVSVLGDKDGILAFLEIELARLSTIKAPLVGEK